jgi:hypothetical protein
MSDCSRYSNRSARFAQAFGAPCAIPSRSAASALSGWPPGLEEVRQACPGVRLTGGDAFPVHLLGPLCLSPALEQFGQTSAGVRFTGSDASPIDTLGLVELAQLRKQLSQVQPRSGLAGGNGFPVHLLGLVRLLPVEK